MLATKRTPKPKRASGPSGPAISEEAAAVLDGQ